MAPPARGEDRDSAHSDRMTLPALRSLNKSISAPPDDAVTGSRREGWLSKLGAIFKRNISNVDPVSRDNATREVVAQQQQQTRSSQQQRPTSELRAAGPMAPSLIARPAPLSTGRALVPTSHHAAQQPQQEQQQPLPVGSDRFPKLASLKRMVSGMFRQQALSELEQQQHAASGRPSPDAPVPMPSPAAPTSATPLHAAQASSAAASVSTPMPSTVRWSANPDHAPRSSNSKQGRSSAHAQLAPRGAAPAAVRARAAAVAAASPAAAAPERHRRRHSNILAMSDDLPPGMDRAVWRIQDYDNLQPIHSGYASYVYTATCKLSRQPVALKIYHPQKLHEISKFQLLREARLHTQMCHPNIIRLYAAFQQDDGVVLVQEYADRGDLLQLLYECGARLSEARTASMVIEPLLKALHYLHAQSIIHRDVKLENILFTGNSYTLKLADFGLCLNLQEERSVTRAGTLDYMAPEVLRCPTKNLPEDNKERKDLAYNCAVDIWAVGVVAYELMNGVPPFTRKRREDTEHLILEGAQPQFQVDVSDTAKEFVYSCLARNARSRPSAHQLLRHPWTKIAARPFSSQGQASGSEALMASRLPIGPPALPHPPTRPSLAATRPGVARYKDGSSSATSAAASSAAFRDADGEHEDEEELLPYEERASLPNVIPEVAAQAAGAGSQHAGSVVPAPQDNGTAAARKATAPARQPRLPPPVVAVAAPQPPVASPWSPTGAAAEADAADVTAAAVAAMGLPHDDPRGSAYDMEGPRGSGGAAAHGSSHARGGSSGSSSMEYGGSGMREMQYSALQRSSRNANEDKRVYQATVDYVDQIADTRRAGRQLQRQQAVVYRAPHEAPPQAHEAPPPAPELHHLGLRWQDEEGAAASPRQRLVERALSELSRHTTDAGYRSATRSRRGSFVAHRGHDDDEEDDDDEAGDDDARLLEEQLLRQ